MTDNRCDADCCQEIIVKVWKNRQEDLIEWNRNKKKAKIIILPGLPYKLLEVLSCTKTEKDTSKSRNKLSRTVIFVCYILMWSIRSLWTLCLHCMWAKTVESITAYNWLYCIGTARVWCRYGVIWNIRADLLLRSISMAIYEAGSAAPKPADQEKKRPNSFLNKRGKTKTVEG